VFNLLAGVVSGFEQETHDVVEVVVVEVVGEQMQLELLEEVGGVEHDVGVTVIEFGEHGREHPTQSPQVLASRLKPRKTQVFDKVLLLTRLVHQ